MRRTWKQSAMFVGGAILCTAACIGAFVGGYAIGWMEGFNYCIAERVAAERNEEDPPIPTLGRLLRPLKE